MRPSNLAHSLSPSVLSGDIAHPVEREDLTVSLVLLEPEPEGGLLEDLREDMSALDQGWDDVELPSAIASVARVAPVRVEEESATFSLDLLDDAPEEEAGPAASEEPPEACLADDMLDPATVDIDGLIDEDQSGTFERAAVRPPRAPRHRGSEATRTRPVPRRSWICMPPGNTNAEPTVRRGLDMHQLEQLVRKHVTESSRSEARAAMPSLPRFPLLPPDPRPAASRTIPAPRALSGGPRPRRIPPLRLPRFNVE